MEALDDCGERAIHGERASGEVAAIDRGDELLTTPGIEARRID